MTSKSSHDDTTARELNDLRLVFANISGYNKQVELRTILKLPEVKAQIAEGDVSVEDLESVWLEACAVKGTTADAQKIANKEAKLEAQGSWGVCTALPFQGFVHFLRLCEERVSFPKDMGPSPGTSPSKAKIGRDLVAARHRMLGMLRATLTLHQRGGAGEAEEKAHPKDETAPLGEILHSAMVRAALEEGLAHHTPGTLKELMRTGVYKACSKEEAKREREQTKASLGLHLSKQVSRDDLVRSGIIREMTPDELSRSKSWTADNVMHCLQQRPSARELVDRGLVPELTSQEKGVERAFLTAKLKHDLEHRDGVDELKHKGILLDMAPGEAHKQHLRAAQQLDQRLKSRSSLEELRAGNIMRSPAEEKSRSEEVNAAKNMLHDMYDQQPSSTKGGDVAYQGHQHHRRLSIEELQASGIYRTPAQFHAVEQHHKMAGECLQQELGHRAELSELKDKGIYRTTQGEAKHRLERSMQADHLNQSLRDRPAIEDLMDRGVLEASALRDAFQQLEKDGPVETLDRILKWPVVAAAVKEGVVGMETLRKAFVTAMEPLAAGQKMTYQEFDNFLSAAKTTQVEEEQLSLKLWAIMRMRPELDEREHHESNRRRNALMAEGLEHELSKREPLENLANKGIYVQKTPAEGAVERAHLTHTLAHALAHRPELQELSQKGVYLKDCEAGQLEEAHRDARNTLEGMLSLRPALSTLEDMGYLEADELEDAFTELLLEYKHGKASDKTSGTAIETSTNTNVSRLLLPLNRLAEWTPVRKMIETGAATEEDVTAALAKAQKASSHGGRGEGEKQGDGIGVDFVGFLEFIHSLDVEVDGLDMSQRDGESDDPGAGDRHARRLQMRRERSVHAAEEESYGTLKEHLLAHLRARPGKLDPETQRMAKGFHSSKAVELEKSFVMDRLEDHLRSRAGPPEASADNPTIGGAANMERAAKVKELELKMNKRMLVHRLAKRPSGEVLLNKGILHAQSAPQEKLQRLVASDAVKHSLKTRPSLQEMERSGLYRGDGVASKAAYEAAAVNVARGLETRPSHPEMVTRRLVGCRAQSLPSRDLETAAAAAAATEGDDAADGWDLAMKRQAVEGRLDCRSSLDELANKGIFQNTTPLQHSLERHLVEKRLNKSLENPLRPSRRDLMQHGLYVDATPRQIQMEHYLAARNLKHCLEQRETVQDLKDHGIYLPMDSKRAAHEKLLVKALLQRKLSHAFSSEELARLKQKGIYKEAEHAKLEAERSLVTRQLTKLVSRRPDVAQLKREHPGVLEASTLALVFEERVMPRVRCGVDGEGQAADTENEGGPEHMISFESLMTWPDVQAHLAGEREEDARHEMAQHFELCDTDGDGFITFSQFLRWVELCDLNPEDHLQVTESDLDAEYARIVGVSGKGVTFDEATGCRLVRRWANSASLDHDALETMWEGEGDTVPGSKKQAAGFKAFCRHCQSRSSAAHQLRLDALQAEASVEEAKAKENLSNKLAAKLSAKPDLDELKRKRIYQAGGLDPATEHLERNLIAISLKEQLLSRPALHDLEKRGVKPKEGSKVHLEENAMKLRQALDTTMQHDDARWRSNPHQLGAGPRDEVSAVLQKSLAKRLSMQQLENKGIYVVDTDASYALLVHQVFQTHTAFVLSSKQLAADL